TQFRNAETKNQQTLRGVGNRDFFFRREGVGMGVGTPRAGSRASEPAQFPSASPPRALRRLSNQINLLKTTPRPKRPYSQALLDHADSSVAADGPKLARKRARRATRAREGKSE